MPLRDTVTGRPPGLGRSVSNTFDSYYNHPPPPHHPLGRANSGPYKVQFMPQYGSPYHSTGHQGYQARDASVGCHTRGRAFVGSQENADRRVLSSQGRNQLQSGAPKGNKQRVKQPFVAQPPGTHIVQLSKSSAAWVDEAGEVVHQWRRSRRGSRGGARNRASTVNPPAPIKKLNTQASESETPAVYAPGTPSIGCPPTVMNLATLGPSTILMGSSIASLDVTQYAGSQAGDMQARDTECLNTGLTSSVSMGVMRSDNTLMDTSCGQDLILSKPPRQMSGDMHMDAAKAREWEQERELLMNHVLQMEQDNQNLMEKALDRDSKMFEVAALKNQLARLSQEHITLQQALLFSEMTKADMEDAEAMSVSRTSSFPA